MTYVLQTKCDSYEIYNILLSFGNKNGGSLTGSWGESFHVIKPSDFFILFSMVNSTILSDKAF